MSRIFMYRSVLSSGGDVRAEGDEDEAAEREKQEAGSECVGER